MVSDYPEALCDMVPSQNKHAGVNRGKAPSALSEAEARLPPTNQMRATHMRAINCSLGSVYYAMHA